MNIQIEFNGLPHSLTVEEHIRAKAAQLEELNAGALDCRVSVEAPHKRRSQGRAYNLRINLHVPGDEIVVNHDSDEDIYVALRNAFAAVRRQLQTYAERQRGAIKHHEMQAQPASAARIGGN
ncbi:MAG TPA: HPF/RaiA family ribosome-associated protein [Rhodocyclaceae bacterium]|nr:HPF/RaiA family ribosome-associated protein [Rhodocyclaceae bacterium]